MKSFSDEYLESFRSMGDPSADEVVASLFAEGEGAVHRASQLLRGLVDNDDVPDSHMAPKLRAFLLQTASPSWADRDRIEAGARLFQRYGPHMTTLLNLYSLPMTYTARKGVQVLARTNRLQSNATRRITETAQMIIDVMKPGGLELNPDEYGAGIRSAQKVRLLHATIRHLILQHDPTWQAEWGLPINQEDMAGTLLSFVTPILDGLERLGIQLSAAEKDAYLHCWNVVGHFLGVREELLTHDLESAIALSKQIAARHSGACPEGQALTKALIETMEHLVPGNLLDDVPVRLMRFFIGEEAAQLLALPEADPIDRHLGLRMLLGRSNKSRDAEESEDPSDLLRTAAELFGRALLQGLLMVFRGFKRQPFDLPTQLRLEWGINWHPVG